MSKKTILACAFSLSAMSAQASIVNGAYVSILMDSSGSLGSAGWASSVNFVQTLIEDEIRPRDPLSSFDISAFSTEVAPLHSFSDDQSLVEINASIDAFGYNAGYTNTVAALRSSITAFDTIADPAKPKHLLLLTDGNPHLPNNGDTDVCALSNMLKSDDIRVTIIGIGNNWSPDRVDCLVFDVDTDIRRIENFSSNDAARLFGDIEPEISAVPLPASGWLLFAAFAGVAAARRKKAA